MQGLVELCWKDSTGAPSEIQTTSLHLHHNNDITQWHILVFKPKYLLIFSYLGVEKSIQAASQNN